jgi:hypothetical protein
VDIYSGPHASRLTPHSYPNGLFFKSPIISRSALASRLSNFMTDNLLDFAHVCGNLSYEIGARLFQAAAASSRVLNIVSD